VLWEWGLAAVSDDVQLLVSELVTNAVKASPAGAAVRLWVTSDRRRIVVMVWDASPELPAMSYPDDEAPTGRGLMIVDALANDWGAYPADAGKVVWALCVP
jgi:anti-sigma regulatory factor (Ser/Thr protein kinase)